MKKIFIGLAVLALSSCFYLKGDYTLGRRNTFNDFFYTYNIRYYAQDEFAAAEIETETVSNFKQGAVRYAMPGGIVVSSKILEKEVYSEGYVRPNKKGALVSYTVPVEFSDEKVYKTIGETEIDGKTYRLLEPNRIGDVVLIDGSGKIYPRVGRIYNDRLALIETSFLLEPDDLVFGNAAQHQFDGESVVTSMEIRYEGIQDSQMVFKYYLVEPDGSRSIEEQKTYTFSVYEKMLSLGGTEIEILNVDNSGIEYRVLKI